MRGSTVDLAPGVVAGEATRQSGAGGVYLRMLRVDLGGTDQVIPDSRLRVVIPGAGPWASGELKAAITEHEAHGGAVLIPTGDGDGATSVPGILFADGVLHAWPASSPLLIGNSEGTLTFVANPASGTARIFVNDVQIELALDSINGPPGEGAALYGGPLDANSIALRQWPAGTEALLLRPHPAHIGRGMAFWDDSLPSPTREWHVADRRLARDVRLRPREWALLLPPTIDEETRDQLAGARTLRIEVSLPREIALSAFAVPVARQLQPDDDALPEDVRTLLAIDGRGNRAILAESGGAHRGEFGFELDELFDILGREGTTQLFDLVGSPQRELRLLINRPDRRAGTAAESATGRAFLLLAPGQPELPAGDGGGGLERLPISYVHGSNQRQIANTAEALFDGVSGTRDDLGHYWAAPLPDDGDSPRQWVEWRFLEPSDIHALDLIHAEDAGYSSDFNLRAYRILARFDNRGQWVELAEVRHDEPVARERVRLHADRKVESLRLEVLEPNFLPGGNTARLVEIIPWGRR